MDTPPAWIVSEWLDETIIFDDEDHDPDIHDHKEELRERLRKLAESMAEDRSSPSEYALQLQRDIDGSDKDLTLVTFERPGYELEVTEATLERWSRSPTGCRSRSSRMGRSRTTILPSAASSRPRTGPSSRCGAADGDLAGRVSAPTRPEFA